MATGDIGVPWPCKFKHNDLLSLFIYNYNIGLQSSYKDVRWDRTTIEELDSQVYPSKASFLPSDIIGMD